MASAMVLGIFQARQFGRKSAANGDESSKPGKQPPENA